MCVCECKRTCVLTSNRNGSLNVILTLGSGDVLYADTCGAVTLIECTVSCFVRISKSTRNSQTDLTPVVEFAFFKWGEDIKGLFWFIGSYFCSFDRHLYWWLWHCTHRSNLGTWQHCCYEVVKESAPVMLVITAHCMEKCCAQNSVSL